MRKKRTQFFTLKMKCNVKCEFRIDKKENMICFGVSCRDEGKALQIMLFICYPILRYAFFPNMACCSANVSISKYIMRINYII